MLFPQYFVAAHQQVGEFKVLGQTKVGGNVASYFCLPDGRVIHAVPGNVTADQLLQDAEVALRLRRELEGKSPRRQAESMSQAHALLYAERRMAIDEFLAKHPLVPLSQVYAYIFATFLGERVSESAFNYEQARLALRQAKRDGRPLLFVIYPAEGPLAWHRRQWLAMLTPADKQRARKGKQAADDDRPLHELVRQYHVVMLSAREIEEVRKRFDLPRFDVADDALPRFFVTNEYGAPFEAVTDWTSRAALRDALTRGLAAMRNDAWAGKAD